MLQSHNIQVRIPSLSLFVLPPPQDVDEQEEEAVEE